MSGKKAGNDMEGNQLHLSLNVPDAAIVTAGADLSQKV